MELNEKEILTLYMLQRNYDALMLLLGLKDKEMANKLEQMHQEGNFLLEAPFSVEGVERKPKA